MVHKVENVTHSHLMKRVDVLIVCTYFGKINAAYRRLNYFIRYLEKRGLKVSCAGFLEFHSSGIVKPPNECYVSGLFISTRYKLITLLNIMFSLPLILLIVILRPKVVILSIPDESPAIATYLGCLLARSKLIIDVRDWIEESVEKDVAHSHRRILLNLMDYVLRRINYSIYRKAEAITAVTRTLVHMLTKVMRKPIHFIPNGADLEVFIPIDKKRAREMLGLNQGSFLFAYIGFLSSYGYYDILPILIAIQEIRKKYDVDIRLVVAGRVYDKGVKKIIERFKDVVQYMEILDERGLILLLSASDAGTIPRIRDPTYNYAVPVKFYEYIAMGLPVIVTANKESELAEIVEGNKLGLVCNPGDYICLEKAITMIVTNKELLNELKRSVLNFRKHVDRSVGAERLFKLIIKLLSS